jgi:hypothetical protein
MGFSLVLHILYLREKQVHLLKLATQGAVVKDLAPVIAGRTV